MSDTALLQPKERFSDIPKGYLCTHKGVRQLSDDNKDEPITLKPVTVKAYSRDDQGNNWGILVWWLDQDDRPHEIAIPKRLFHVHGAELAQLLADGGLPIIPGKERKLLAYLASFDVTQRLTAATCTGWLNSAFVLPSETINEPEGERIVYQPSGLSSHAKGMKRNGQFEAWQTGITEASSIVCFLICASLSAPLRYLLGVEAGGFHIFNETSRGKTTALQAAASVWGSGVDPQRAGGNETYISRWNATANALEARAELHNDLPMVVDEIGEGDSREFGRTIYRIFSGTGRDRSGKSGELRDAKSWRVLILSAGEIGTSDFIESGGTRAKGGQLVRMVDINLDHAPTLFDDSQQADAMKDLCAEHFGHAGPEFLKRLPDDLATRWKELDHTLIGSACTTITERVRKRFALVWYTGVLAVRAGILPWSEDKVLESVRIAYQVWMDQVSTVSDTERGIRNVANFMLAHESRFETRGENFPVHNRAGWKRDDKFHFTSEAFKEACSGADPNKVKRALKEQGLLHTTNKLQSVIKVDRQSVSVVSVKAELLSYVDIGGIGSSGGSTPEIPLDTAATSQGNQGVAIGSAAISVLPEDIPASPVDSMSVAPETPLNTEQLPPLHPLPTESSKPAPGHKVREVF